mmetsp:Transcript_5837/g.12874  ORF Transcript_5837/g.12874 Transcript_5837/m.12874 type:complete len:208 (+) Transcript_5837:33-656(+)
MLRSVCFLAVVVGVVGTPFLHSEEASSDPSHQCSNSKAVQPFAFPVFKQCDPRWGSDEMVTTTVCKVGCLMSSISSALNGRGYTLDGAAADPGTLNAWLRKNDGYDGSNDLKESVIPLISPQHMSWNCTWCGAYRTPAALKPSDVQQWITEGRIVIANVDAGHHFVLVTGYDPKNSSHFYVNDSGFARNCYPYSEVVGWRVFEMDVQ